MAAKHCSGRYVADVTLLEIELKHFEMVLKSQTITPQDHMSIYVWFVNYSEIFSNGGGSAILMNMSFLTVLKPFHVSFYFQEFFSTASCSGISNGPLIK